MTVETCMFLTTGTASPTHSVRVTRITRNTNCVTVSTITTNAPKPSAVPKASGSALKVPAYSSLPTPAANRPPPPPAPAMDTAIRERKASVFSENIAPPPTGSASVSYSNCRAVPTDPNSACQPEIAPQAMVTNSIGHSGCQAAPAVNVNPRPVLTASSWNAPIGKTLPATVVVAPVMGARTAPTALSTIVISVIQKP